MDKNLNELNDIQLQSEKEADYKYLEAETKQACGENYTLAFAGLGKIDIDEFYCKTVRELYCKWRYELSTPKSVTLINVDNKTFISHIFEDLKWFINYAVNNNASKQWYNDVKNSIIGLKPNQVNPMQVIVIIHEYNSYEEAYKVALNIAEIYPNCYE